MFTYSKTKCIVTLNLCLLRRYIADILHRGLATTQATCCFHSNRSRGNLFTLANKTYIQFGKICFKLDYRFMLCFAFLISVYKSLYLFLSLWLGRAHTSPLSQGTCRAFIILFWKSCTTVGPGVHTCTKTPRWGLKIRCKCHTPGQHQNCIFL